MAKYYYHDKISSPIRKRLRLIGLALVGGGLAFLVYFFLPVISYHFFLSSALSADNIETPVPKHMIARNTSFGEYVSGRIESILTDYTDARNWYPKVHAEEVKKSEVPTYQLSIPKLKIENAFVSMIDYDLSKQLVHYYGPKNPTDKGTSVIYGHSSLPQWFDPKNYKTIFATLHNLENGDVIFLNVEGKNYPYKIYDISITDPDDVDIFSQTYDNSYITLVTCTPPGTTWKRLIIRAALSR